MICSMTSNWLKRLWNLKWCGNRCLTMVEHLPQNQKEVVFMRYYQELSFKEIADITGVSINTALGRMRYALLNLRKMAVKKELHLAIS